MKTIAAYLLATFLALPASWAAPNLNTSPQDIEYLSIEFGEIPLNETGWVEVGLNAPEDRAMDIYSLMIFGEMYDATTTCGTRLDPGKYCVLDLFFTPTAQGEHYGEMSIKTSEGNVLLKLYGTGK